MIPGASTSREQGEILLRGKGAWETDADARGSRGSRAPGARLGEHAEPHPGRRGQPQRRPASAAPGRRRPSRGQIPASRPEAPSLRAPATQRLHTSEPRLAGSSTRFTFHFGVNHPAVSRRLMALRPFVFDSELVHLPRCRSNDSHAFRSLRIIAPLSRERDEATEVSLRLPSLHATLPVFLQGCRSKGAANGAGRCPPPSLGPTPSTTMPRQVPESTRRKNR